MFNNIVATLSGARLACELVGSLAEGRAITVDTKSTVN
jgi:hypothetical protein